MRQFKQKAIEWAQLAEMNHFRSQLMTMEDVTADNNLLVNSRRYTMIHQALLLFRSVVKMDVEYQ